MAALVIGRRSVPEPSCDPFSANNQCVISHRYRLANLKITVRTVKRSVAALAQRSDHIIGVPDESAVGGAGFVVWTGLNASSR
jgi:hypothetical protein